VRRRRAEAKRRERQVWEATEEFSIMIIPTNDHDPEIEIIRNGKIYPGRS
jgi:hypothetical protein